MKPARILSVAAFCVAALSSCKEHQEHQLEHPLMVYGTDSIGVLPQGTVLRFDRGFAEGFSRYQVFINVEAPLELRPTTPRGAIDPLISFDAGQRLTTEQLIQMLRSIGATQAQVRAAADALATQPK